MKERIAKKLMKDRPMVQISIRMPEDVITDLKRVAEAMGFSGYQALVRYYVGQSLRKDLEKLESVNIPELIDSLKRHGLSETQIHEILAEAQSIPA